MSFKISFPVLFILIISKNTLALPSVDTADNNEIDNNRGIIRTSEDLVTSVINDCSSLSCVKDRVLSYLDSLLGLSGEENGARELNYKSVNVDKMIYQRVARLVKTREFKTTLPGGILFAYNPSTGVDLDMPVQPDDDPSTAEARGLLKKKLLLPVLLLLKLKLKALMPIFVALIGLKSMKALILSKLAILLVVGFLIYQLCIKGGMMMPMMMGMGASTEAPTNAYGPPPMMASTPSSSYEPSWEPSAGGPYSRIWTNSNSNSVDSGLTSGQNIAYSAYYPVSRDSSTNSPIYRTN